MREIENEIDYARAVKRMIQIFHAELESKEGIELTALIQQIEQYEIKYGDISIYL